MNTLTYLKHQILDHIRFYYHRLTNDRMKQHFKRYKSAKNKKTNEIIKDELSTLRNYWGHIPTQYYTHDFYLEDCGLTIDEMKKYIPSYYFYKVIFPLYDDVNAIIPLIENKICMNNLFRDIGLEQSNIIFIKTENEIRSFGNEVLSKIQVDSLLNSLGCSKIFIKPVMGRGGKGIIIAKRCADGFEYHDEKITFDFLAKLKGDYVVETVINQHSYLSCVYSNSVNTVRAITVRDKNGEINFIAATLRMGVAGSEIDNSSAGGLLIGIDLTNGKCLRPYATYEFGNEKFYLHPDSGFNFSELQIPNWNNVKELILKSAHRLTQLNLVGWDIAVTNDGIVVIEANTLFGLDHTQAGVGGLRDYFLRRDPNDFHSLHQYKGT